MIKLNVWYSIADGGDGSAHPNWYLSEASAERDQDLQDEGWGESCTGRVETYVGSNVYLRAVENEKKLLTRVKEDDEDAEDDD